MSGKAAGSEAALSAETVGTAAAHDPQLRVPVRPRIRRGLQITMGPDQVEVTGGPRRQVLSGRSASTLLPALLEACDGRRDHADLARLVAAPVGVVFKALALLWTCGVVEEACPEGVEVDVADEVGELLSRLGDSTGMNDAWELAALRLRDARVEVFGDRRLSDRLVDDLRQAGTVEAAAADLPQPGTSLVVHVDHDGDDDGRGDLAQVARHCWDKGVPLLRLRLAGRTADLGPLVDPRITPCLACLTADGPADTRPRRDGDDDLAVSLLARDVFAVVTRAVPLPLPTRWRRLDLHDLSQQEVTGASRPGCTECSATPGGVLSPAPLAARYEAAVAMPPREFADVKAHQMHYKPSNLALQHRSRTWPVAPAIELPGPDLERLRRPWSAEPAHPGSGRPDLVDVSVLLRTVAGTRSSTDERVQRWTAAGGNIGSVTAYLAVRDCPGLPAGVYGYVLRGHRLARLSSDVDAIGGTAPVTVVLTGDFGKVAQKYGAFALRIVLLDSGCAQATAGIVCSVLGIAHAMRDHWDDDALVEALGVDRTVEPVTAVLDLGGRP